MVDKLVSMVFAACNQGDWVRKTIPRAVESLGAARHEIIVVDDQSTDGCCKGLPRDVLIVRTKERLGVSRSRRLGVSMARGDVLLFSDPHCEYEGSLGTLTSNARNHPWIWQPNSKRTPDSRRIRSGGRWAISTRGLVVNGRYDGEVANTTLIDTVYAVRKDVYDRLGGWPELPGFWGYSEQGLSLAAWFGGVPVVVDTTMEIVHYDYHRKDEQGKGRFSYSVRPVDQAVNAHYTHALFFPITYPYYWKPMIDKHFAGQVEAGPITEALSSKRFKSQSSHVLKLGGESGRTEEQFFKQALGMEMPTATPVDNDFVRQQALRSKPGKYKGGTPERIQAAIDWFIRQIPGCLEGRAVIDLGTRDGYGAVYAIEKKARVAVGVEVVPEVAAYASERLKRPVVCGDMRSTPYPPSSWDCVWSIHSLEHVPDPEVAVAEMVRLCKPGGWILIVVPLEQTTEGNPYSVAHNTCWATSRDFNAWVLKQPGVDIDSVKSKEVRMGNSRTQRECRVAVKVLRK